MSESKSAEELVTFDGKAMYPEVAEYFRLQRQAERTYNDAEAEAAYVYGKAERAARAAWEDAGNGANGAYFDAYRERRRGNNTEFQAAYEVYDAAISAANTARGETLTAARDQLRNSPHPEVKWIEAHALSSEQGYSHTVLKALPVNDPSELWEIKRQHGMCGEFDRLYAAAELDGVFNGGNKSLAARELAAYRNWISRNWGDRYAAQAYQQLSPAMKRIEEKLAEEVAKQVAEAKAEWQKLDEARAENARRNRSEAQKRAWAERRAAEGSDDEQESSTPEPVVISTQSAQTGEMIRSVVNVA